MEPARDAELLSTEDRHGAAAETAVGEAIVAGAVRRRSAQLAHTLCAHCRRTGSQNQAPHAGHRSSYSIRCSLIRPLLLLLRLRR